MREVLAGLSGSAPVRDAAAGRLREVATTAPKPVAERRSWKVPLAALAAVLAAAGGAAYFQSGKQPVAPVVSPPVPVVAATPTPAPTPRPLPATAAPTPKPATPLHVRDALAAATKDVPFINSLGMEFVPVPGTGVLFCRWETRVQDYRAFADATKHEIEKPTFAQTDDHPAVNISWEDAKAFCAWLSKKEGREYRLPTDGEWSTAVGLPRESGATLADKDIKVADVFPWGTQWPPPKGAGNYSTSLSVDDFANTAPVGSFPANRFGIHDLGGNVWEWCEDLWKPGDTSRVLRGGSFGYGVRVNLLSSVRGGGEQSVRFDFYGCRVVVVGASSGR